MRIAAIVLALLCAAIPARAQSTVAAAATASAATPHLVTLGWSPSTTVGVDYRVYRNGKAISNHSTSPYTDVLVVPGATYTYQVSAFCPAAAPTCPAGITGESALSSPVSVTIPITPPAQQSIIISCAPSGKAVTCVFTPTNISSAAPYSVTMSASGTTGTATGTLP